MTRTLREDEDPLEPGEDLDLALAPAVEPETPPEGGNEGGGVAARTDVRARLPGRLRPVNTSKIT